MSENNYPETRSTTAECRIALNNVLNKYMPMKQSADGNWWYSEWENHRRKVVHLERWYTSYIINWGYNYDFTIQVNKYHRTEKSFFLDVQDDYSYYISCDTDEEEQKLSWKYKLFNICFVDSVPRDVDFSEFVIPMLEERCENNMTLMLDWFKRVNTLDEILAELDRKLETDGIHTAHIKYATKAFLLARAGRMIEAEECFNNKRCCGGEKFYKQMIKVSKMPFEK